MYSLLDVIYDQGSYYTSDRKWHLMVCKDYILAEYLGRLKETIRLERCLESLYRFCFDQGIDTLVKPVMVELPDSIPGGLEKIKKIKMVRDQCRLIPLREAKRMVEENRNHCNIIYKR